MVKVEQIDRIVQHSVPVLEILCSGAVTAEMILVNWQALDGIQTGAVELPEYQAGTSPRIFADDEVNFPQLADLELLLAQSLMPG